MNTKIIAECCYNHNGSMDIAKQLIDNAKKLNLWAVKFQKWDIENFPVTVKNKIRDDKNSFGHTYYDHRKFLELSIEKLLELKVYAENLGLIFICSGKDILSLKLLVENNIRYIKIPSQKLLDKEFYYYLNKFSDLKIFVSTGMCNENEIINNQWIDKADCIMHCISNYPANLNDCDLSFMKQHDFYNGYSSHEIEGRAIKYAVACGAKYIERHFTLSKNMKGTDHFVSSDYKEMERIITEIEEAEMIQGSGKREMNELELRNRSYYRSF
jgi:sialic acid synthase SpsE